MVVAVLAAEHLEDRVVDVVLVEQLLPEHLRVAAPDVAGLVRPGVQAHAAVARAGIPVRDPRRPPCVALEVPAGPGAEVLGQHRLGGLGVHVAVDQLHGPRALRLLRGLRLDLGHRRLLCLEHHVVVLYMHLERLCHVGTGTQLGLPGLDLGQALSARLEGHAVAAHARLGRPHERLPGLQVVLPAVPGTRDPQGVGQDPRRARRVGRRVGQQVPAAQRPALVRAAVADAVEAVTYPEHANRPAPGLDDPALARGELADDRKRIEAVLAEIGSAAQLAVDANGRFDLETAIAYAKMLRDYPLFWYEEAGDPLDFALQAALAEFYPAPMATGENLFSHQDARNLLRYGGMRADRDWLQFDCALSYGLCEYLRTLQVIRTAGWSPRRCIPHGGHQMSLNIAAGLGLGGNENYPDLFQPFGGFPDGVRVENGYVTMLELPGIGFEGKAELIRVMRQLAE